jgi:hypothetical protein
MNKLPIKTGCESKPAHHFVSEPGQPIVLECNGSSASP